MLLLRAISVLRHAVYATLRRCLRLLLRHAALRQRHAVAIHAVVDIA